MAYTPFPIIPGAGSGGGGGSSVHNDLTGRSAADAHPTSAITGLAAALAAAGNVDSVNGQTGTVSLDLDDLTDVDTATDPPATDDVLAWDGTLWTPAGLTAADVGAATQSDIDASIAAARGADNGLAPLDGDGTVPDIRLPASIARDSEVTSAVSAHAGATDPHGDRAYSVQRANHTGTQAQSTVTNLTTDLAAKAPLASPTFTGTPAAPTASQGTNTTQVATTAFVQAAKPHAPYTSKSGWYRSTGANWTGGATFTASRVYYTPFLVTETTTFDRIGVIHSASAAASQTARLGIYDSSNDAPNSLVLDAGTISFATAAAFKEITINQQLTPGLYWLAVIPTSATPSMSTTTPFIPVAAPSTPAASGGCLYLYEAGSGNTLPSTATGSPTAGLTPAPPAIFLRVA